MNRHLQLLTRKSVIAGAWYAVACSGAGSDPTQPWTTASYFPAWASAQPVRMAAMAYDNSRTSEQNGAALADSIAGLQAGDRLEIGAGIWSVNRWWNVVLRGTELRPIWIAATAVGGAVITRPDANQNVMNVAASAGDTTEFVCFRGLDFTGGSEMIRLYGCRNVWIDSCTLHDGGGAALTANTNNTEYIYITRNHIYNPGPDGETDEGMYLGANNGIVAMRYSIVALNHVHDCGGSQGDGIEMKQGSYNNWLSENYVHNTNYPCFTIYGTGGKGINVIERNVCHNSNDNAMQVQGEAIVRNNLIIYGAAAGFASTDHQGQTVNLTLVHNTIINGGVACNFSSWNSRQGMVCANNAVYSRDAESLRFPNGSAGVILIGNVVFGSVSGASSGYLQGTGLTDFVGITWDAIQRDGRPSSASPLVGAADPTYAVMIDINGTARGVSQVAGAFATNSSSSKRPQFGATPIHKSDGGAMKYLVRIGYRLQLSILSDDGKTYSASGKRYANDILHGNKSKK